MDIRAVGAELLPKADGRAEKSFEFKSRFS